MYYFQLNITVKHNNIVKNPLVGIIFCEKCGKPMQRRPYNKYNKPEVLMFIVLFSIKYNLKISFTIQASFLSIAKLITRPRNSNFLIYDGLHEAIIDNKIWELVQEKRKQNTPKDQ